MGRMMEPVGGSSEAVLRAELFETAREPMFVGAFDGRALDANAAMLRLLGASLSDLQTRGLLDFIHEADRESTRARLGGLEYGAASTLGEFRVPMECGGWRRLSWSAVPATDRSCLFLVARDVTERSGLYDVARSVLSADSPEDIASRVLPQVRGLLSARHAALALCGPAFGDIRVWVAPEKPGTPVLPVHATEREFGGVEELRGGRVQIIPLLPAAAGEPASSWARELARSGLRSALRVPLSLGGHCCGALEFGADTPQAFPHPQVVVALEIASQVALAVGQIRLRERADVSEGSFRSIAANADGLVIIDAAGAVRWANPAADALFGLAKGGLTGLQFGFPVAPGERLEIELTRQDGRPALAEMRVVQTEWEGHPAWLASLRDRTEQRELEAHLVQAQKMAVVGRLAGSIAHDFNNLLTAMMGNLDLLRQQAADSDPAASLIHAIEEATDRASGLVRQLLAFSRKQVVAPHVIDVNRCIRKLRPMLAQICGEDVELELNLEDELPAVRADPIQLEQVVMNLVVNARDAISGRGRIQIGTRRVARGEGEPGDAPVPEAGDYVCVAVRDDGAGIPKGVLGRIFEPFFTTKEAGRGLGLGLSTVHDIVRKSGGTVHVESDPGRGSVFEVLLPPCDGEPQVAEPSSHDVETLHGGPEPVVVVDDEESIRVLVQRALKNAGYSVTSVADPQAALRVCCGGGTEVHLLLTDVRMPEMNGRELARLVRAHRPEIRVLFMSGYDEEILAPQGVLDRGVELLAKPFRLNDLLRKVRSVLEEPPAPPTTELPEEALP
jgi:PAS domain S-box-containing protein